MLKIAEYTQKALELRNRAIKAFNAAGLDIRINENEDTGNIKLVFAGQYSAGKSSILKMLTGRNDIAIGAGITTQKRIHMIGMALRLLILPAFTQNFARTMMKYHTAQYPQPICWCLWSQMSCLIHISLNISENWLLIKTKPVK